MSEPLYRRAPRVVWRQGPDRVLVRRIGSTDPDRHADLFGAAALVWVVLDRPAGATDVASVLHESDVDLAAADVEAVCADLVAAGWVEALGAP